MALFDTLKRYTGINVVECSSVRDFRDLDISIQNKIENGRLSGWLDKDTRTVRIYTGRQGVNEDVNRQRLVANVLNLSLAQLGWDGFFLPERKASALNMLQILADNDGFFKLQPLLDYENANPVKMLNEWITDTRPSKELTAFLCRLLELPNAESVERNIQFAMNKCLADRVEKLKNEGNLDVLSEDILQALRDPKHRTSVSIGIRPHALMRCGYPPYPVRISTQWIQGIQKESGLSNEEFAKAFASSIRNPIAVMESTMISKDGENQYIILLDIVNKSGKRAALLLDRPGKVADNIRKNRFNQMSPYSPLWMTPNQVVFHINHGKAKNMREKGEEGSRDFDLVREIEKSEPGPSAVRNSASDARVLRIDTKVVENFFNSKYYTENFSRLEEDAKNAEQIQRKAAEQPAPDTTVKPVATDNRTIQEKMAAGIDGIASLSAKEKARLHEMKIHTLGELRNAGPAALSKTFNKAQITNFECILEENGLSFYTRPRAVSPSEFATFNEITKAKKQKEDFITALQYIRQDKISGVDIPYPTKLDHSFFDGEAAVHMFVKSASRSAKWDWAPVFISTEEMQRFRLTPSASADPVHVKEDGVWKSYYNITETNLKEVNPELYAQELKFMDEECVTGLSYPATALSTMLAIRELTGYPQKGPDAFTTLKRRTEGMVEYYGPRFTEEVKKELDAEFSVGHGRNNINKDSDEYRLATEMTKFLVDNLMKRGVKIEVATEEQARAILERERSQRNGRDNIVEEAEFFINDSQIQFRLSNGTIYGYQLGDTIYLTPAGTNPNTPIHEYAHLWSKVLQQLEPEKWESLKEELKSMPEWAEIAASADYEHIRQDEDRLAGEVLATVVGNKGEDLQMEIASQVLSEGKSVEEGVAVGVERLREKLNNMVAKDVFGTEGLAITGETTLKVLKDFVEGRGVQIDVSEGEKLAAMATYIPDESYINNERQSKNSTVRTSQPGENASRFVKSGANVRSFSEISNYLDALCSQIKEGRSVSPHEFIYEMALSLGFPENIHQGNISLYFKVGDKDSLRLADHYGDPEYFKEHNHYQDNYGIVIKMSNARFHPDPTVEYIENIYFPDLTDASKQVQILTGLKEYVLTGNFSKLPKPDKQNVSHKVDFSMSTITKQANTEYLCSLSYNDKMALFAFFNENGNGELSEIDWSIISKAYQTAIAVPTDVPEVDESVIRNSISTSLNLALENLSEEALDAISKHVKIERATEICINNPLHANTLLGLADSEGARMLEALYEKNLNYSGIQPLTIEDIVNEMRRMAESAAAIVIANEPGQDAPKQIELLARSGQIKEGDSVFIREKNAIYMKEVTELSTDPVFEYDLRFLRDTAQTVFLREDGTISRYVDDLGEYDQNSYNFSEGGLLICASKEDGITESPAHAVVELFRQVRDAVPNMNVLEIAGLQKTVQELIGPIAYYNAIFVNKRDEISDANIYRIEEVRDSIYALNKFLSDYKDKAKSEFLQYAERGFRTNNTLWDRITGKTFNPTVPLPSTDCIKHDGMQFKEGSISVKEVAEDNIPIKFYRDFVKRCEETPELPFNIDFMPLSGETAHREPIKAETKELLSSELPQSEGYDKQLELCGRIDKPIPTIDGNYIIVQQDGDHLISMKPEDAKEVMTSLVFEGKVKVDGVDYIIDNDNLRNISSGTGQWLKPVDGDKQAYVVFDIKQQRPVLASNYESALRKVLSENSKKAQEKAQNEGLNQNKSKQNKKGSNRIK